MKQRSLRSPILRKIVVMVTAGCAVILLAAPSQAASPDSCPTRLQSGLPGGCGPEWNSTGG